MWILIKFYALNHKQPGLLVHKKLMTYNGIEIYKNGNSAQEHRIQFLVTLVLRKLKNHVSDNVRKYEEQYSTFQVFDKEFANVTALYVNQLLRENDWHQALLISSFMPVSYTHLRKSIVLSILQTKASDLV